MYTCRNCGDQLRFDIRSQKMVCDSCKSSFDPESVKGSGEAKALTYEMDVYTCPCCGGEITATQESVVDYCSYCGSFTPLQKRSAKGRKVQYIIPFARTKEDCMEAYRKASKKAIFAPSGMKRASFIERMRGIYMPYWLYDVEIGGKAHITVSGKKKNRGGYEVQENTEVPVTAEKAYENIAFDASSSFRDNISAQLTPFASGNMKDFTPAYMAGFYGSEADISADFYKDEAQNTAANVAMKSAQLAYREKHKKALHHLKFEKPESDSKLRKNLDTKVTGSKSALLPVWFLTWKNKNSVSYAVVNGESGECYAQFPVSLMRFLAFVLLLTVPLFLAFNATLTLTAQSAMFWSSALCILVLYLLRRHFKKSVLHELHENDPGFWNRKNIAENLREKHRERLDEKLGRKKKGSKAASKLGWILLFIFAEAWEAPLLVLWYVVEDTGRGYADYAPLRTIGYLLMLGWVLAAVIRTFKAGRLMDEKKLRLLDLLPIAGILVSSTIHLLNPVADLWYYAGAAICMGCVILLELVMILDYNQLVTEEVPNYFKAGSNPKLEQPPKPDARIREQMEADRRAGRREHLLYGLAAAFAAVLLATAVWRMVNLSRADFQSDDASHVVETASIPATSAHGDAISEIAANGRKVIIADKQSLLSDSEVQKLLEDMKKLTAYGNVLFVSDYPAGWNTGNAAARTYDSFFKEKDGTEFYFDMHNRKIYIYSMGSVLKVIDQGYANSITDNVYKKASRGDYYGCAASAFAQIFTVLDGGRIAQPMKVISNALLGLIMAFLIGYSMLIFSTGREKEPGIELIAGDGGLGAAILVAQHGRSRKVTVKRQLPSSGGSGYSGGYSGGSSGGFSGGGGYSGGGGGGFSGGGGGHSF